MAGNHDKGNNQRMNNKTEPFPPTGCLKLNELTVAALYTFLATTNGPTAYSPAFNGLGCAVLTY